MSIFTAIFFAFAFTKTNASGKFETVVQRLEFSTADKISTLNIFAVIAFSTLVSEDLTSIAAGVLAGNGGISLTTAVLACIFGVYVGDILLYLAGRFFGRKALNAFPLKFIVKESSVEAVSSWFEKKGVWAIFLSRFIPGFRLPTYFLAGTVKTDFVKFAFYFLLAVCIWTPLLVLLSYFLGAEFVEKKLISDWWKLALFIGFLYFSARFLLKVSTWRGRRLLCGKIRRIRHWEFWSMWMFYPPIVFYILFLAFKFRSLTIFTCVNPAISSSGFVGESKNEIYLGLKNSGSAEKHLLKHSLLKENEDRIENAKDFITQNSLAFPLVLKPDVGERGKSVFILKDFSELEKHLSEITEDFILQEFASGVEFGVFYYRFPNEAKGKIFAATEKHFPEVIGDGVSTLETLILRDERAVCLAEKYFERNAKKLSEIPENGEKVALIDIGTHSRGAVFLDGNWVKTLLLEEKIDRICREFEGFYFGRFDIRTPSIEYFKRGENFKIIELNGVTSEATNIYDRKNSLLFAYKTLFRQWRIAFEIGRQNFERGAKPTNIATLAKLIIGLE
ncbi:MAG TPA: VTT domain-containing protein [Pyrinomonadaceae bacterium]|nr:VTT domain-containing protein [Pyrinomonadaceae bacterium]